MEESSSAASAHRRMREVRLWCEKETQPRRQKAASGLEAFRNSLDSLLSRSQSVASDQATTKELVNHLSELEHELVTVKIQKESAHLGTMESLSTAKSRTEELQETVKKQSKLRDEYKTIISQQLLALPELEHKGKQDQKLVEEFQQAISWYNRVLGIRIEGGQGVKFSFTDIDLKNPKREFSFTIRYRNGTYILVNMHPLLNDTQDLVQELNQTNHFFKFVRLMREKFSDTLSVSVQSVKESLSRPLSNLTGSLPLFCSKCKRVSEQTLVESYKKFTAVC